MAFIFFFFIIHVVLFAIAIAMDMMRYAKNRCGRYGYDTLDLSGYTENSTGTFLLSIFLPIFTIAFCAADHFCRSLSANKKGE